MGSKSGKVEPMQTEKTPAGTERRKATIKKHKKLIDGAIDLENVVTLYNTFITESEKTEVDKSKKTESDESKITEADKTHILDVCKKKYIELVQEQDAKTKKKKQVKKAVKRKKVNKLSRSIEQTLSSLWRPKERNPDKYDITVLFKPVCNKGNYFEEGEEKGVPGENPRRPALRKGATCQTAQTGTRSHVLVAGRIHTGIGDRRVTTAPHTAPISKDQAESEGESDSGSSDSDRSDSDSSDDDFDADISRKPSIMDRLLYLKDPQVTLTVLKEQPFRALKKPMVLLTKSFYNILLLLHLIYLVFFLCLPGYFYIDCRQMCVFWNSKYQTNNSNYPRCNKENMYEDRFCDPVTRYQIPQLRLQSTLSFQTVSLYIMAVTEPLILFLFYGRRLILRLRYEWLNYSGCCAADNFLTLKIINNLARGFIGFVLTMLPLVLATIYLVLVVACQVIHSKNYEMHVYVYVYAMASVLGWLYSICLTRGLKVTRHMWTMTKIMIGKDLLPYFLFISFVTIGFNFAFHAGLKLLPYYYDLFFDYTWFSVFNLMYGREGLFTDKYYDAVYLLDGSLKKSYAAIMSYFYVFYVAIAATLLFSMLIAMMEDSYTKKLEKKKRKCIIDDLRIANSLIKNTSPLLLRLCLMIEKSGDRWLISLPPPASSQELAPKNNQVNDKNKKSSTSPASSPKDHHEVKNKEDMQLQLQKMEKRLDEIFELLDKKNKK